MNKQELEALIYLLDDPDENIYSSVSEKLISLGDGIIPELEQSWESDFNALQQERIEHIIHQIQFKKTRTDFENWNIQENPSLREAVFLINQFHYPSIETESLERKIKLIAKDIWLELNTDLTPVEQINVFNHIFYKVHKFKHLKYEDAKLHNYFLSNTLDNKSGTNVIFGLLYQMIALELNIPVYGICLPDQFILARTNKFISDYSKEALEDVHVLFFINPNQGSIFTKREIIKYLQKLNLKRDQRFYLPSNNHNIIKQYLRELLNQYKSLNKTDRVDEIWELLDFIPEEEK